MLLNKTQKTATTEAIPPDAAPPQLSADDIFTVVAGPNRQEMNFPSMLDQDPGPTEFDVNLPCGTIRLALNLLANYSYSRMNAQVMQVNGKVVGISDDGNKLLPEQQALWEETLKECPIRMSYDIFQHTGKLFLQSANA